MERRFAQEYGWTPAQVDALPAEFVDEQVAIWQAIAQFEAERKPRKPRK